MSDLTSYRVTYDDGTSYVTMMAAGVTLTDARNYFLGKVFVDEDDSGKETRRTVVAIERGDA